MCREWLQELQPAPKVQWSRFSWHISTDAHRTGLDPSVSRQERRNLPSNGFVMIAFLSGFWHCFLFCPLFPATTKADLGKSEEGWRGGGQREGVVGLKLQRKTIKPFHFRSLSNAFPPSIGFMKWSLSFAFSISLLLISYVHGLQHGPW